MRLPVFFPVILCLVSASPAWAQDMILQDFVTPQIGPQGEVDRAENERLLEGRTGSSTAPALSPRAQALARAEGERIMRSHRPRMEREYNRRVRKDGKPSANRWLKAESHALGQRTARQMRIKYAGQ